MYRFVIEHPKWIPLAAQKKLGMRAGDDKGRIYRSIPQASSRGRLRSPTSSTLLVSSALLDSPNGPQRSGTPDAPVASRQSRRRVAH
jgi:hypothetical protein